ncbi:hypothetical protein ACLBXM_19700 [Xanthobacteraceae bacterium A53D]
MRSSRTVVVPEVDNGRINKASLQSEEAAHGQNPGLENEGV